MKGCIIRRSLNEVSSKGLLLPEIWNNSLNVHIGFQVKDTRLEILSNSFIDFKYSGYRKHM